MTENLPDKIAKIYDTLREDVADLHDIPVHNLDHFGEPARRPDGLVMFMLRDGTTTPPGIISIAGSEEGILATAAYDPDLLTRIGEGSYNTGTSRVAKATFHASRESLESPDKYPYAP